MPKIRLLSTEHGKCGVLRRYQHVSRGVLEVVTVWGRGAAQRHRREGSADVIYITDLEWRTAAARSGKRQREVAAASPPRSRRRKVPSGDGPP